MVEERYNSKSYGRLRSRNTIESAIEMTQNCDTNGLRILLTNHWADVSAHYLDVISSFPETWSPHDYKWVVLPFSFICPWVISFQMNSLGSSYQRWMKKGTPRSGRTLPQKIWIGVMSLFWNRITFSIKVLVSVNLIGKIFISGTKKELGKLRVLAAL